MTEQQAIAYIESILSNYDRSVIEVSKLNPHYHHIDMWLGDKDMIALEMAKEALKRKGNRG